MGIRSRRLFAPGCACLALLGCEFDKTTIPAGQSQVVVQSVLDPGAVPEVLVERTLSGGVTVKQSKDYDPLDPINSSGGIPVAGASISITGGGQTWVSFSTFYPGKPASYGAGRYIMATIGQGAQAIRPGVRYTLTVKTPDSVTVTGTTVVPNVNTGFGTDVNFNRDRDTLRIGWSKVDGARAYALTIDSPYARFQTFTDSTKFNIAGDLQNVFSSSFRRVFFPGFNQTVTVYAADTNYFDYYRSINDPFTGSGIINKLTGGLGLFGSIVVMHDYNLAVTQNPREPAFEGNYVIQPFFGPIGQVGLLTLYVESGDSASATLSGAYVGGDGLLGTRAGNAVELQFLVNQDQSRVFARFSGTWSHDSLIGTLSGGVSGNVVYKRFAGLSPDVLRARYAKQGARFAR